MSDRLIDPKTTALVAIDLQYGVLGLPLVPHSADDVVGNTAAIAAALAKLGGTNVYVSVGNAADGADALAPVTDSAPASAAGRPANWSQLSDKLDVRENDVLIVKRQWGAFYGTELELQLRRRGISTIILTGVVTHIGVESTARQAYERGFNQIFVEDAMSAMGEAHQQALGGLFPRMGRIRSTRQILDALS